jgi:hypothetical protein
VAPDWLVLLLKVQYPLAVIFVGLKSHFIVVPTPFKA